MIFGMIFKIFHESGSLGRAARFQWFSHQWNTLWSWIWYPRSHYGLEYGIQDTIDDLRHVCVVCACILFIYIACAGMLCGVSMCVHVNCVVCLC